MCSCVSCICVFVVCVSSYVGVIGLVFLGRVSTYGKKALCPRGVGCTIVRCGWACHCCGNGVQPAAVCFLHGRRLLCCQMGDRPPPSIANKPRYSRLFLTFLPIDSKDMCRARHGSCPSRLTCARTSFSRCSIAGFTCSIALLAACLNFSIQTIPKSCLSGKILSVVPPGHITALSVAVLPLPQPRRRRPGHSDPPLPPPPPPPTLQRVVPLTPTPAPSANP